MIKTFKDSKLEKLFREGKMYKGLSKDLIKPIFKKLAMLEATKVLTDLYIPPSNRFEALSGNRKGQYSISVNMKYRLCFRFKDGDIYDLELTNHYK